MSTPDLNATAASLLGFLHDGAKTGWDLVCAVEQSVGYFWNVTRSQVYRELKTLAAAGYVTAKGAGAREKVPYAITAAGRAAFGQWIAREPGPDILRLPLVLTVFFGRHLPPPLLRRYLEKARLEHLERLEEYRRIEESAESEDEYQLSTLKLGIAYEKTLLSWIEGLPWIRDGGGGGAKAASGRKRPK